MWVTQWRLIIKGTDHDFFWQRTPMSHIQKERKINVKQKKHQTPCKIADIMKKTGFLASFILGGALSSVFNFLKFLFYYVWIPRKLKGGIGCGGHLAVTYGGELIYLRIFSYPSPPNHFVERKLPFLRELKSRTHIDYRTVNRTVMIMCADCTEWSCQIRRYNNSPSYQGLRASSLQFTSPLEFNAIFRYGFTLYR